MTLFRGLYTALVTPFDSQGAVNEKLLRELLRMQIEAEVDGIVVLGTTGETPTLKHEEKLRILGIAKEETAGKLPLIVGTGSYSTEEALKSTVEAKKHGADAALIVTPYYNRPSQEGLYQHYKTIAEAVDIPIIVYNHQGRTGQNLQPETLARIAKLENVWGVKETTVNLNQMAEVIEQVGRKKKSFAVLAGDDVMALPNVLLGGDGVISVASNLVPLLMRKLTHAGLNGSLEEARERHYALMPLFRALNFDTNPIPVKAAMRLWDIPVGEYRLPLCPLSSQNLGRLKPILDDVWALLKEENCLSLS